MMPSGTESERTPAPGATTVTTRLELPTRTIVKVVLTLAVIWLLARLWPLLLLLVIAMLLAAAFDPFVGRMQRRGWPRPATVTLLVLALVAILALVLLLLVPPLIEEGGQLADEFPSYAERARDLVDANEALVERVRDAAGQSSASPTVFLTRFLAVGAGLIQGVANVFILLVLTIYLLVDGQRVYEWAMRYLPARQRAKVRRALPEISRVVGGYLLGQAITSLLFGVFAFLVLWFLDVPQPVLLAVVAAFADAIPIAGILIATIPAVLLALTVSWQVAGLVFLLYVGYQQLENYVIVPRVYRGTLQISSFAVLVAVLVGGQLLGIVGVLLALPIAAAVPVIERIWREDE